MRTVNVHTVLLVCRSFLIPEILYLLSWYYVFLRFEHFCLLWNEISKKKKKKPATFTRTISWRFTLKKDFFFFVVFWSSDEATLQSVMCTWGLLGLYSYNRRYEMYHWWHFLVSDLIFMALYPPARMKSSEYESHFIYFHTKPWFAKAVRSFKISRSRTSSV